MAVEWAVKVQTLIWRIEGFDMIDFQKVLNAVC